jgi:hypothetical protein
MDVAVPIACRPLNFLVDINSEDDVMRSHPRGDEGCAAPIDASPSHEIEASMCAGGPRGPRAAR